MLRRPFALILGALVLIGCKGITEDNYAEKVVEVLCEKNEECYADYFAEYWDNVDECIADLEDYFYFDDYYDDCEFDSKSAKTCLNWYDGISCEDLESGDYEYEDACEQIWDCPDEA